jgi:hypothetical protein
MIIAPTHFILEAFDPDLLYPWLAQRFAASDPKLLRRILRLSDAEDQNLENHYCLTSQETDELCAAFSFNFCHGEREVVLFRERPKHFASTVPYLLHGGYELALMIHNRKPFAFVYYDSDYEESRRYKARFDHFISQGLLYSENEIEIVDDETGRQTGRIFYARKGEEWRIPAYKFMLENLKPRDNGFEIRERLEGTLLGYEQWQNDWWLSHNATRNSVMYGASFRCALSRQQYVELIYAGFRSLPRFEGEVFSTLEAWDDDAIKQVMDEDSSIEAIVQFNLGAIHLMNVVNLRTRGPYKIPTAVVPIINRNLSRPVVVLSARNVTQT